MLSMFLVEENVECPTAISYKSVDTEEKKKLCRQAVESGEWK